MFEPTDTNIPKTPFSSSQPPERKQVPPSKEVRCLIRDRVEALVAGLDRRVPIDKYALEVHARVVLEQLELADAYLGWTMVMIGSAFWKEQVAATPLSRRLLLLPHCLRDIESCPARFNEFGLMCKDCGACRLSALRARAEKLGYQVLIAEGSPVVMQILIGGHADAMLGVSCLDVLEKSLEKILLAGIPCMAVPLIKAGCQNTETDDDWVLEMIEIPYRPTGHKTQTYVHLLRCAKRIFQPEEFDWLVPRDRQPELAAKEAAPGLDPLAATESIAYDFALRGGKRARPFVTLAVYDAITGGGATGGSDGAERAAAIPDHVKRVAVAIEIFHKASLVHDDLEDDDPIRYGRPTLHCQYSTATAINVGDYLIGLGYRVVAGQCGRAGAEAVVDILAQLAESHTRLCEGQGAELAWREADDKRLTPLDALKIYALKTAPAFEAALYAGVRLAGPVEAYGQPIHRFARYLGVAFQILNDLKNWRSSLEAFRETGAPVGSDIVGCRPTVLWALALESVSEDERRELETLLTPQSALSEKAFRRIAEVYRRANVESQADRLVSKHHERARRVADEIQPAALKQLFYYLADSILDR